MPGLFTSRRFFETHAAELDRICRDSGLELEPIPVPDEGEASLDEAAVGRIELAYVSNDLLSRQVTSRRFFGVSRAAPNLRWIHLGFAGTDAPIFGQMLERGVRVTTSSGDTAVPIAQTAIAGLLHLSRGFDHYIDAQRRKVWERIPDERLPRDLAGQTIVVLGLGSIGNEIARLAGALGMHVIGVRRSPRTEGDHVDELHPPSALLEVLPRADWLAIACPLTEATRGIVSRQALEALPAGAHVLNVARGEVVDEDALIEALRTGHVAGAYLDVFREEPLPPESPLWEMPRVLVTPHNSTASQGNIVRTDARFLRNLEAWARGGEMENEVRPATG